MVRGVSEVLGDGHLVRGIVALRAYLEGAVSMGPEGLSSVAFVRLFRVRSISLCDSFGSCMYHVLQRGKNVQKISTKPNGRRGAVSELGDDLVSGREDLAEVDRVEVFRFIVGELLFFQCLRRIKICEARCRELMRRERRGCRLGSNGSIAQPRGGY